MNLHAVVSGAIGAVNPFVLVSIKQASGYTTNPDGTQVPTYNTLSNIQAQIQALSSKELQHLDALNIQGTLRKIYFFGEVDAILRNKQKGGDVVTFPDGTVWLTTSVYEQWPDWCSIVVTLQNNS